MSSEEVPTEEVPTEEAEGDSFAPLLLLRAALERSRRDHELSGGARIRESVSAEIHRLRPAVEARARSVGFRPSPQPLAELGRWAYSELDRWLSELIGHLQVSRQERTSILIARLFEGSGSVASALERGDERAAVFEAAGLLEATLQELSGTSLSTRKLAADALHPDKPKIEVSCGGNSDDERQYQNGVQHLAMGAFAAFRNPGAHGSGVPLDLNDALAQVIILLYLRTVAQQGGSFGHVRARSERNGEDGRAGSSA